MGLRSAEQFIQSLRDGRAVYYAGEKVADVTTHPDLGLRAEMHALQFGKGEAASPEALALGSVTIADGGNAGERVRRWFVPPRSAEDLRLYLELEERVEESSAHGAIMAGHAALKIVAAKMDAKLGTDYLARIEKYSDFVAKNDLSSALAMTDAKGDRSKPPSGQVDPDLWLRVVERRPDGIVISGAKTSVSNGAVANELLVYPTHAMAPADADWAVACAVPANAPGVRMISNFAGRPWGERFAFDKPLSHSVVHHDATVVFDRVFVPNDRVFMDGQHDFTRTLLTYFTSLHRMGVLVKEPKGTKKLIGVAQLMARYNGLEGVGGIRNGIGEMVQTAQILDIFRYTAMSRVETVEGICVPYGVACNLAGLLISETKTKYMSFLCELAGGPVLTAPSGPDLTNPETRDDVLKYYVGKPGVSAIERLKLVKYIYDIAASDSAGWALASAVTAAGSPSARRVAVGRNFNVEECVQSVLADLAKVETPALAAVAAKKVAA